MRRLLLRWGAVSIVMWAVVALVVDLSAGWLAVIGAYLVVLLADILWLSYRVRRDERRGA